MNDKLLKKMEDIMILMDIQDSIPLLYPREETKKLLDKLLPELVNN